MSNQFNFSLWLRSNYNNKNIQLVSWLLFIFFEEVFVKKLLFLQGGALIPPLLFKFLSFLMCKQFNVSLFSRSKYNNKDLQLVSWLVLIIFFKEDFQKNLLFSQGDALIHPLLFKFLCILMCNQFNVSLVFQV